MTVGVFLQVRLGSTRLPGKALLPLAGRSSVEHAMDALRAIRADVHAILTDAASAPSLAPLAAGCGFETFIGPAEDVLLRYALAVEQYGVDTYIRATGDNPLVSGDLAEALLEFHLDNGADFSGYQGPPLGTGVEVTESAALLTASAQAVDPYEREHVSPFIYRRPERFKVLRPTAPERVCLPSASVTLDTAEDYAKLKEIYDSLYRGGPIPTETLVTWLRNCEEAHEGKQPDHSVRSVDEKG